MSKDLLKYSFIACFINLIISWIPFSPILCFVGSGIGAYLYQKSLFQISKKLPNLENKLVFTIFNILIGCTLVSFVFMLVFYYFYLQPVSQDWLKIKDVDYIIQDSPSFKYIFLLISFTIASISSYTGSFIAFNLGIGSKQITDKEFIQNLNEKELLEYV
ncbi:MAG: hypothetical protein QNJ31_08985 [Candidatus Caenarcaniphilales bacterium]|nr:hypothetical protein [Candidatus Caenarcaniphilales bacterium]